MDSTKLREVLRVSFEHCWLHDAWVEPLALALSGVSAEQALRRPPEGKGIWDIVLHLAVWNENIVERLRTGEPVRPAEGDWPSPPSEPDQAEWQQARERLQRSLLAIDELIETTGESGFEASPFGYPDLICRFVHNGYHLGQIVQLRKFWTD